MWGYMEKKKESNGLVTTTMHRWHVCSSFLSSLVISCSCWAGPGLCGGQSSFS